MHMRVRMYTTDADDSGSSSGGDDGGRGGWVVLINAELRSIVVAVEELVGCNVNSRGRSEVFAMW